MKTKLTKHTTADRKVINIYADTGAIVATFPVTDDAVPYHCEGYALFVTGIVGSPHYELFDGDRGEFIVADIGKLTA